MQPTQQVPNYKNIIIPAVILLLGFIGYGLWIQDLQTKLADVTAKVQAIASSTPATNSQVEQYLGAAIQAGILPDGQHLQQILQQQQRPEQQEPLPVTPSSVPTKK